MHHDLTSTEETPNAYGEQTTGGDEESRTAPALHVARLWRTRIAPASEEAYDAFVQARSFPMFETLPGCLGVLFLGSGEQRAVLSLWSDLASIDALGDSDLYHETVDRLLATGILREPQTVALFPITAGIARPSSHSEAAHSSLG